MNSVANQFYCLNIKDYEIPASEDITYNDFIWELNCLDNQLKTYLTFEDTAKQYIAVKMDKIPKRVCELFPFDYWAYHLFNGLDKVEFHFENPYREIKSVWVDKSSIRNVERLTLYLNGRLNIKQP